MSWEIKQHIDFYLDDFKPPRLPEDLRFIVVGLGIHATFALLLIGGLVINSYAQSAYLQQVTQEQAQVENEVANLETERPSLELDEALVAERDKAGNNLESSRRILQYLTQQDVGQSYSFRSLVGGLTEQTVSGVWLSGFRFSEEGQQIRLTGHAYDPKKVSGYAGQLLDKAAYQGRSFRFIQVNKTEGESYLTFTLDTENKTDDTAAKPDQSSLTSRLIMQQI